MNHFSTFEKQIIDSFCNTNTNEKGIDVLSYILEQVNSVFESTDLSEIKIHIDSENNIVNILFPFILTDPEKKRDQCISHLLSIISIIKFLQDNRYIYLSIKYKNDPYTGDNSHNTISFADKEMTDILSSKIYITKGLYKFINDRYCTPGQVMEQRSYRIIKSALIVSILALIVAICSLIVAIYSLIG